MIISLVTVLMIYLQPLNAPVNKMLGHQPVDVPSSFLAVKPHSILKVVPFGTDLYMRNQAGVAARAAFDAAQPAVIADFVPVKASDRQPQLYALIHHLFQAGGHGPGASNTLASLPYQVATAAQGGEW
jgi:hypothetical protein